MRSESLQQLRQAFLAQKGEEAVTMVELEGRTFVSLKKELLVSLRVCWCAIRRSRNGKSGNLQNGALGKFSSGINGLSW